MIDPTSANNTVSINTVVNDAVYGNITKGKIVDKTKAGKDFFKIDMTCDGLADAVTDLATTTVFIDIGTYGTDVPGSIFILKGTPPKDKYISKQGKSKYTLYPGTDRLVLQGTSITSLDGTDNDIPVQVTIGDWSCFTADTWTEKPPKPSGNTFTLP